MEFEIILVQQIGSNRFFIKVYDITIPEKESCLLQTQVSMIEFDEFVEEMVKFVCLSQITSDYLARLLLIQKREQAK